MQDSSRVVKGTSFSRRCVMGRCWRRSLCSLFPGAALVVVLGGVFVTSARPSAASPESGALIDKGAAELGQGHFAAALQNFDDAAKADAADAQAPFFQGVACNRLGRFEDALLHLQKAAALGGNHPDQAFEMGFALTGARRWNEVVAQLERYEAASPGRGQTQEFLGRAYSALGQYGKAERAFNEALRRDARLAPTVRYYQSLLAILHGRPERSGESVQALLGEAPNSLLAQLLRGRLDIAAAERLPLGESDATGKPWSLAVSLGAGYNSNVLFLGNGLPLPVGAARDSAALLNATFDGAYRWQFKGGHSAAAGYSFNGNFYHDLSSANESNHLLFADYRHRVNRKLTAGLELSDNFTQVSGSKFSNQFGVKPSLAYGRSRSLTELSYGFSSNHYYTVVPAAQDRDGRTHAVALSHSFQPRGSKFNGQAGLFHSRNNATGPDFDFKSTGVFIALRHPLGKKTAAVASYTHTWDRYDNLNSQSTPPLSVRRRDNIDVLSLQLIHPLREPKTTGDRRIDAYLRYAYRRADSNIATFQYNQHVVSTGIIVAF